MRHSKRSDLEVKRGEVFTRPFFCYLKYSLPVFFMLTLYPMLVGRTDVRTYTEDVNWLPDRYYESDFFLFVKMTALYVCAGFMLSLLLWSVWENRKTAHRRLAFAAKRYLSGWLLVVYGLFAVVSSLLSENRLLSIRGISGNMQGAVVVCCYLFIFFYSMWWAVGEKRNENGTNGCADSGYRFRIMVILMGAGSAFLGIVGISQLFGFDLLSMGLVKEFLGGREAKVKHFIYLTLYHWNYVGSYVALLLPVAVAMIFYGWKQGRKKWMTVWFVLFYLLVICLCGSQSRTGAIGVVVSGVLAVFLFRNFLRKCWKPFLAVAVSVLFIAFFCNLYITGSIWGKWNQICYETKGSKRLSYMITGKDEVKIRFKGEILRLQIEGEGENITPDIRDKNGKSFMLLKKGKTYHVGKKPLDLLSFTRCEIKDHGKLLYGYRIHCKKASFVVTNQFGDGSYYYQNACGKFDKMIKADTAFPSWMNGFASLRGFVWSRTVPLLKETIFLGVGAEFNDSFLTVAPVFWCLAGVGEGLRFRKIRRKSSGATWISPLDIT